MILFELFYTFLIIGLFTFGGGYSMVALIQDQVVVQHSWLTAQEFTDILAISQMTPGPIGINPATFTGYSAAAAAGLSVPMAILGAFIASFAVVLLPVTHMLVVGSYLQRHMDNPRIASMFRLLRMAVVGLIAAAALSLLTPESFGLPGLNGQFIASVAIFAVVFFLSYRFKTSPILLILGSGLVGWLLYGLAGV